MENRQRGKNQPAEKKARAEKIALQERAGMKRWVALGVIADNLINLGKAMAK